MHGAYIFFDFFKYLHFLLLQGTQLFFETIFIPDEKQPVRFSGMAPYNPIDLTPSAVAICNGPESPDNIKSASPITAHELIRGSSPIKLTLFFISFNGERISLSSFAPFKIIVPSNFSWSLFPNSTHFATG